MESTQSYLKCSKCIEKPVSEFYKNRAQSRGYDHLCKDCKKPVRKKNYEEKKETVNASNNEWYRNNKDKKLKASLKWRKENRETVNNMDRRWASKRKKPDRLWVTKLRIRGAILRVFKNKHGRKRKSTEEILGCSIDDFISIIGISPGTWYHLDHICPVSQALDEAELMKLNHYSNFQWLSEEENNKKSDKSTPEAISKCRELLGREWYNGKS